MDRLPGQAAAELLVHAGAEPRPSLWTPCGWELMLHSTTPTCWFKRIPYSWLSMLAYIHDVESWMIENQHEPTDFFCMFPQQQPATINSLCQVRCIRFKAKWPDCYTMHDSEENLFCIFFVIELSIRFGAYEKKTSAFRDIEWVVDLAPWIFHERCERTRTLWRSMPVGLITLITVYNEHVWKPSEH